LRARSVATARYSGAQASGARSQGAHLDVRPNHDEFPFFQAAGGEMSEDQAMTQGTDTAREGIYVPPGEGRVYEMGRITSIFKADGTETANRYSISEWWLEPDTAGPGPHSHDEDDVFYVLEGVMSILVGDRWIDAPRGAFVLVPGGMTHDFENRSNAPVGVLNVSAPGPFEPHMPGIVQWFQEHPPGPATGGASSRPVR
jgi:mannose-6-phosphate isomerase-like protein (cupin superfamily)